MAAGLDGAAAGRHGGRPRPEPPFCRTWGALRVGGGQAGTFPGLDRGCSQQPQS